MTLKNYRKMDLILLSILAVLAEFMGLWLHSKYPLAGFYISFSTLISIIAMLRWGKFGVIVSCVIAIPTTLLSGSMSLSLFLFYVISNCSVILLPVFFKSFKTSNIISKSYLLFGYVVSFYGVLTITRGLIGVIIGLTFFEAVIQTINQLLFIMIINYIVLILVKKREGLLVDMATYFINEQKEIEE
jgi:hypothetical protein